MIMFEKTEAEGESSEEKLKREKREEICSKLRSLD